MSRSTETYPTSAFDYALPAHLIARQPLERRDASRLLIVDRGSGALAHGCFTDLLERIPPGDALVLNESRVIPARFCGRKPTGAAAEVLLLHPVTGGDWRATVRPGAKLHAGARVVVDERLEFEMLESHADGTRTVRLHTSLPEPEVFDRFGRVPLPPYLGREAELADRDRYQTVYARQDGSVAAPTAGLHFTEELLAHLESRGVRVERLVLHVGLGTFRPVEHEDPSRHRMHAERFELDETTAGHLNDVHRSGGALWAVGTTAARVLETLAEPDGRLHAGAGWTSLFIRPPWRFRATDHLLTNFHLPRSTLLMLVAAFAGYDVTMCAYREAVEREYRFYSYGDAMLIV